MRYHDCPVCGAIDSLAIEWSQDSDGDPGGMYGTRSWIYPEIATTECGCLIPAEAADSILAEAEKDGPPEAGDE